MSYAPNAVVMPPFHALLAGLIACAAIGCENAAAPPRSRAGSDAGVAPEALAVSRGAPSSITRDTLTSQSESAAVQTDSSFARVQSSADLGDLLGRRVTMDGVSYLGKGMPRLILDDGSHACLRMRPWPADVQGKAVRAEGVVKVTRGPEDVFVQAEGAGGEEVIFVDEVIWTLLPVGSPADSP